MIVCAHDDWLPQASVAVHVLVITSVLPQPGVEESLNVTVVVPQLSVAVAVPVHAGSVHEAGPHCTVALDGHEISGAKVSLTVTT